MIPAIYTQPDYSHWLDGEQKGNKWSCIRICGVQQPRPREGPGAGQTDPLRSHHLLIEIDSDFWNNYCLPDTKTYTAPVTPEPSRSASLIAFRVSYLAGYNVSLLSASAATKLKSLAPLRENTAVQPIHFP